MIFSQEIRDAIANSANLFTMGIAIGLLFTTLLQPHRERLNWVFAFFLATLGIWSYTALSRSTTELQYLDTEATFYFNLMGLGFTNFSFYIFVISFCHERFYLTRILNGLLPFITLFFLVMLWTDNLVIYYPDRDTDRFQVLTLGYIFTGVMLLYAVAIYIYLRRSKTKQARYLEPSAIFLIIGFGGNIFDALAALPFDTIMATLAAIFMGRAVLRHQLFSPMQAFNEDLKQRNEELRRTTEELKVQKTQTERLNEELRLASRYKSEFLANMSHELRTPLNSIVGYSELLAQGMYGVLAERQHDRVEKIYRNGRNLLDLINDILDLSKIEAGRLELSLQTLNLHDLIAELAVILEPNAQAKHLKFSYHLQPDLAPVYGDSLRIRQVLTNLLGNALKFTKVGSVELHVFNEKIIQGCATHSTLPTMGWLSDGDWVIFEVKDTGIGISPEKQSLIFEAFRQADGTTTREFGGTGLGLAISKRLVEMHHGRIWVKSSAGQGSSFYVALPAIIASQNIKTQNRQTV